MKSILIVLLLSFVLFAQRNSIEFDTTNLPAFKGTGTVYSKWIPLASWERTRIDIMAADTSKAGFALDTLKFYWGVQCGHVTYNKLGNRDTVEVTGRLICDTFNMTSATSMHDTTYVLDGLGSFTEVKGCIDTLKVTGYAVQSVEIPMPWDQYFRIFATGLSGQQNRRNIDNKINILRGNK